MDVYIVSIHTFYDEVTKKVDMRYVNATYVSESEYPESRLGVVGYCISGNLWLVIILPLQKVIGESLKVNASMPEYVLERIYQIMEGKGVMDVGRVGLYGLTFKEDVVDYRDYPTLQLLDYQKKHLAKLVKVYNPFIEHSSVKN